jgi:hypothetical protein
LVPALGSGGLVAQDTITAQGFDKNLTWIVQWSLFLCNSTFGVAGPCSFSGGCSALPGGVFAGNVQLPSVNGENLQYEFCYTVQTAPQLAGCPELSGWGELASVQTPYGATVSYTYSNEGLRGQYYENGFAAYVCSQSGSASERARKAKSLVPWPKRVQSAVFLRYFLNIRC